MKVRIGNYRSSSAKSTDKPRIVKVQIHPWDTYSVDHTLALVIYPMLVAFKEVVLEKGSVPHEFLEEVDVTDLTEEQATELQTQVYGAGEYRWIEVLDKMIWAFGEIKNDYEGEAAFFTEREAKSDDDDVTSYVSKFDIDNDGLNDYYEKIDEGLSLFSRYYRSLWW